MMRSRALIVVFLCVFPSHASGSAETQLSEQASSLPSAKEASIWIAEARPALERWLVGRRAPGKPWGRFEPVVDDAMRESACYARTFHIIGLLDKLKPEDRREWAGYIKSFQDPRTGGGNVRDLLFGIASLGHGELTYPVRIVPNYRDRGELVARIEKMPWQTNPWGAGSQLSSLGLWSAIGVEQGDDKSGQYLRWMIDWLEKRQDPKTGLWGNQNRPMIQRVNGAMKVVCFFCFNLGWELPRSERVIDSCLVHLDNRKGFAMEGGFDACSDLDVFLVIWQALRQTDHRRQECRGAAIAHSPRMCRFLHADGGFGMTPCEPGSPKFREPSTYHGTALMVLALAYWLPILEPDAMQELGWHEPRWSGPVWDAQRLAEVIGR